MVKEIHRCEATEQAEMIGAACPGRWRAVLERRGSSSRLPELSWIGQTQGKSLLHPASERADVARDGAGCGSALAPPRTQPLQLY